MRRMVEGARRYFLREPNRDVSRWLILGLGGLIVFLAAFLWFKYSTGPTEAYSTIISLTAGLSFMAIGLAESLPSRWRAGIAALRAAQLVLAIIGIATFVLLILSLGQIHDRG